MDGWMDKEGMVWNGMEQDTYLILKIQLDRGWGIPGEDCLTDSQ